MVRAIATLAVVAGLAACSAAPPPDPGRQMAEKVRAWIEAERVRDRDICAASHRRDTARFRNCLADRADLRREHLRALRDWYRMQRPGGGGCVDPLTGGATACYEI